MSEDVAAIVIDGGSGIFKAGFAGDESPSVVFSSLLGSHPKNPYTNNIGESTANVFVGEELNQRRDSLSLRYPIEHGIVTNWEDYELLLSHCFKNLQVDPVEQGIVMSEPPLNPISNRQQMTELIFEGFDAPAFYVAQSSELNLYASGRNSGIVIDIGDGITSTVPFYESHCLRGAVQRQDFGGRDLTHHFQKMLYDRGHSFTTTYDFQLVREMKESLAYVTADYNVDSALPDSSFKRNYTLPDGSKISVDKERFQCPEALFNPSLAGLSHLKGLPELIKSSLLMCDIDVRRDICVNFLVTGGCALFPGLKDRLMNDLDKMLPCKVRVVLVQPMAYAAWIGGSILGSLSTFQSMWISKQDYQEHGPSVCLRRSGHHH